MRLRLYCYQYKMAARFSLLNLAVLITELKIKCPFLINFVRAKFYDENPARSDRVPSRLEWIKGFQEKYEFYPVLFNFLSLARFKRLRSQSRDGAGIGGRLKRGTHQTPSYRHKVCSVWPEESPIRPSQSVKCSRASLPITDRSLITILISYRH